MPSLLTLLDFCTALTDEYELDLGAKTQPPVSIDDLLFNTYHLMAVTKVQSVTARCRQQHSTLRKIVTSRFYDALSPVLMDLIATFNGEEGGD
jgi:hypothetical protein